MRIQPLTGKIAAIAGAIVGALLVYAVFDMGLFYGPWPWQSPREHDRVVHPSGFSIIRPRGWRTRVYVRQNPLPPDDFINLTPGSMARITPCYSVHRLPKAPDTEPMQKTGGYAPVKFQGRDALGREAVSGKYWIVDRIFERNGRWYAISLLLPDEEGSEMRVPAMWWPYLESFKPGE